jgi:Flp pilus assembly pilin Flp
MIGMIGVIRTCLRTLRESEGAATAVEYAIMVGFIAAVIVGAVTALGLAVAGLFTPPDGWPF